MLRPKSGMTSNLKIGSKTVNNIESSNTSNYQLTKKQHDKNKKQIELKSKIDIPIDDHNRAIKKEKLKQIAIKEEPNVTYNQCREESKKIHPIQSKSKEKVHKKTLSEIPKTMSNLDTSEQEEEDEVMFSVSYHNRLNNKSNKFMNLKKKNEALTYENDSLLEENANKKKKVHVDYAKTDVNNNTSQGYNLLNYSKNISPIIVSKGPTSEHLSTERLENLLTDEVFMKDQRYLQLLDKYTYVSGEYKIVKNNENDFKKSIELLSNLVKIQNIRINELINENLRIKRINEEEISICNKEKEKFIRQNSMLKSIILKIYGKMSNIENEEMSRTNELIKISNQLLEENQYLRLGVQNVLGNSIIKEITYVVENKGNDKNNIPVKKKRNPTQINFDFLENELNENKLEENQENINQINEVNKFVQDFKITKKSKTMKPAIDPSLSNSEKSQNSSVSSTSSGNNSVVVNDNYLSKKLDSHQTNIKPRQHYLFPKTPNNDDKKNFEFKTNENKDENVNK